MDIYIVGGAVRDRLLNLPVKDRDWVVVGATPEQMLNQGFRPVGKDFPVFLHPDTQEEYALARTERKIAKGYHGFTFHTASDVTLEQDLARRDLTINAIAEAADGSLTDPYHGQADLRAGILRHVSAAFAEDPVRILRLARFAARFDFAVAPETMALMRRMVDNGEADALVAERVWQELAKGLMEDKPSRMILVLRECGALARVLPEVDALFGVPQRADYHPEIDCGDHTMRVLDYAASTSQPLAVRFAALTHDLGKALTPPDVLPRHIGHEIRGTKPLGELCQRLRVPSDCRDLAHITMVHHTKVHQAQELRPATVLKLFKDCDALRRPDRFRLMLDACLADARGRLHFETAAYPQKDYLNDMLAATLQIDAGAIAAGCSDKAAIPATLDAARTAIIANCKEQWEDR
ncbi:multifunctional CCA addition/repair protein [Chromobacterium sphagni]|uniref:Multifunctional CCA protein n=1 Tax=Chromobacterium sphagni TaxID=1903179 RepID=A0A1S1WUR5_9NEIS|nr:multifunctional CCA addition/repair protein [Chromobacterium sphagni]OHX10749.1 multifunctional CCA tRNA nucleotidyl transferase/2'3'-cyclic phosphodiesterase/2'nucleotidase/phosphatase [Chromobacterium sphagni]OHX16361.1 multifunctional CCA tRNA nucleotidyl transferase/2'3'-cyclic phosphodiesterase/2'nucleotidase/phosphatase [Chromobacterium sphagni]